MGSGEARVRINADMGFRCVRGKNLAIEPSRETSVYFTSLPISFINIYIDNLYGFINKVY